MNEGERHTQIMDEIIRDGAEFKLIITEDSVCLEGVVAGDKPWKLTWRGVEPINAKTVSKVMYSLFLSWHTTEFVHRNKEKRDD